MPFSREQKCSQGTRRQARSQQPLISICPKVPAGHRMDTIFPALSCAGCKLFEAKKGEEPPSLCFIFPLICTQTVLPWAQVPRKKWFSQACLGGSVESTIQASDWAQGSSDLFLIFLGFSSFMFSLFSPRPLFLSAICSRFSVSSSDKPIPEMFFINLETPRRGHPLILTPNCHHLGEGAWMAAPSYTQLSEAPLVVKREEKTLSTLWKAEIWLVWAGGVFPSADSQRRLWWLDFGLCKFPPPPAQWSRSYIFP